MTDVPNGYGYNYGFNYGSPSHTGGIVFATPAALIAKALRDIGVIGFGRAITPSELEDGVQTLNLLLDELGVLRENINVRVSENFPFIIGKGTYTIGEGGDFNTIRPIKIEQAYYRDSSVTPNVDYVLDCTSMDEEDYISTPIKDLQGSPQELFYKPDYPQGEIFLDVAPSTAWQLAILSWKPFAKITDANDGSQLLFPDGYEALLCSNLSVMLCSGNKKSCPPEISDRALRTRENVAAAYSAIPKVKNWGVPTTRGKKASFFTYGGGK